jgi:hypothetical protein
MKGKDAIKEIMKLRGFGSPALAKKLGYAAPSGVTERLRVRDDVNVNTLVQFLEAMDCTLVVKSNLNDRTEIVIDGKNIDN